MLSIKQVTSEGEIYFWEGVNLRLVQRREGPQNFDDRILYFDQPMGTGESLVCSIDKGTIYIMNSAGKTIDRYFLGKITLTPEEEEAERYANRPKAQAAEPAPDVASLLATVGRNEGLPQDAFVPPIKASGDHPVISGQRGTIRLRRVDGNPPASGPDDYAEPHI